MTHIKNREPQRGIAATKPTKDYLPQRTPRTQRKTEIAARLSARPRAFAGIHFKAISYPISFQKITTKIHDSEGE